jgi:hypothetical protein
MNEIPLEPRKRSNPEHPAAIQSLCGELSEDRKRVRVAVELDRDDTRPDLDLRLIDAKGTELCHSTIIEILGTTMSFTLHIRKEGVVFPLTLDCQMSYVDDEIQSEKEMVISGE